ncbi:DUF4097 domain-containing protein [Streptomyces sp. NBC_01260]|uniref:DUF4097 family beta strand repeat-containing protein n=1 Tax=unclassified Streptomyces TaxID=2593676 RepID=UPI000F486D9D|nr:MULTISPECIES: DUF4097 family beta strand repeat-containing protein [unclassified Streptomyces]MCX4772806.1 DUF4097 domain-containing protein [Streptomyces sp. NBC_01285]ROQ71221.1 putative adhesin [Streptomyces sp. CEV 2-1]RPK51788.1 hypothetical protein EES39_03310 [Streptomyces sp. ADI92-24]
MAFRTRTRTRTLIASGGAVIAALVLSGCGGTDADDAPVDHKSFAFSGKTLTIDTANTTLELVPADVKKVEVTRQVDGWVVLGSGPNPHWEMQGGTLTLKMKCKALISDCASKHQVKVPRGVSVTVRGDNGKIVASGFDTPLDLRSDNGKVTVRDSSGPLKLDSANGGIVAEGISGSSVKADSDNGAVRLGFTAVPTLVDTVSDNGKVTIELPGGSTSYAVSARADNGNISVEVPRSDDSRHVVKARSNNGEVTVRSAN